jgi:N-acetylglucosaminyl-diphospho-decaprenol L-rhamnosyltransferase
VIENDRLGIVVVTYGASQLLESNLATIDTSALGARVVIVDNFHSDDERAAMTAIAARHDWTMLPMPANLGFGTAANHGVRKAQTLGCSAFLLLNPDARISAESIKDLWQACEAEPMTMQSPLIERPDGSVWFRGGGLDARSGNIVAGREGTPDGWLTGACLMVHGELWGRLGGFDPDFFLYWEDVDLSRRCLDAGGQLRVRHDLIAVHEVGGTQGATKSTGYYYFNCRNRLLFAAKHLPTAGLVRWILATPMASFRVLSRGGGRSRMLTSPTTLWAGIRGSAAGLALAIAALVRHP